MVKAARTWNWMVGSVTLLAMIALVMLAGCGPMDMTEMAELPVEPTPDFVPGEAVRGPNFAVPREAFRPAWAERNRPRLGVPLEALPRAAFPDGHERPELGRPLEAEADIAPLPAPVRPRFGVPVEAIEPTPPLSQRRPEFGEPRTVAEMPPLATDPRLDLGRPGERPAEPAGEECQILGEPRAVVFTSTKPGTEVPTTEVKRYSIYSTTGVFVGAYLQNLCGAHQAGFEVWAPDGTLFKQVSVDFEAQGKGIHALKLANGYLVGFAFPISGTPIAQRPIIGTWSINFGVGDSATKGLGLFVTHP